MASPATVHPSSIVDAGAQMGTGTRVWHFCHISEGARLGTGCSLGQNVFVARNVTIGNNVKIQNNVSIYEGVTLEDDVFCGPSMVFTNVKTPRSAFPRNRPEDYAPTLIRRGASLGANSTIVCGVTVGEWAFVAAGAVVTRSVAPYALMMGVPAVRKGWVCRCGELLGDGSPSLTCGACRRAYTLVEGALRFEADQEGDRS